MKALQLIESGKPVELQEVEVPDLGSKDVLVQVKAAGICHSDAHYMDGKSYAGPLPITLGHEVAGIIQRVGKDVRKVKEGDRVCIHYLVSCGQCSHCNSHNEQFCAAVEMIGKNRDGGWAEGIIIPERNVFRIPDEMPFDQAAIMMCSSSTSLHAINKAKLQEGESVAVFGAGGLGLSAIQLAFARGASKVFAVDLNHENLELAAKLQAIPVNASAMDPVQEIIRETDGKGVDVSLELIGNPITMAAAVQCLDVHGRAAIAGISDKLMEVDSYNHLINKETEIIGVSDHTSEEIRELIKYYEKGDLNLDTVITEHVPLDEKKINSVLERMRKNQQKGRVVIMSD